VYTTNLPSFWCWSSSHIAQRKPNTGRTVDWERWRRVRRSGGVARVAGICRRQTPGKAVAGGYLLATRHTQTGNPARIGENRVRSRGDPVVGTPKRK